MRNNFELENHQINFWSEILADFNKGLSQKPIGTVVNKLSFEEIFFAKLLWQDENLLISELDQVFLYFVYKSRDIFSFAKIISTDQRLKIAKKLENNRCKDFGYHQVNGSKNLSLYGVWLAFGAYQCLGVKIPNELKLLKKLKSFLNTNGGCCNQIGENYFSASATYVMIDLLGYFEEKIPEYLSEWLLARHKNSGGYSATEKIFIADLFTTYHIMRVLKKMGKLIIYENDEKFINSLKVDNFFYKNHQYIAMSYEATFYAYCLKGLIKNK